MWNVRSTYLSCIWTRSEDVIQSFYASILQMNDPIHKPVLININGAVVVTDDYFG